MSEKKKAINLRSIGIKILDEYDHRECRGFHLELEIDQRKLESRFFFFWVCMVNIMGLIFICVGFGCRNALCNS